MDTRTQPPTTTERTPQQRRRWTVAAIAALAVLVVGGALLLARAAGDTEVAGDPAIEVVESFFDEWNVGNAEAAMALVDPEVTVPLGPIQLGGLIEWSSQFDGRMEAACVPGSAPGTAICDWAWVTAGTEALGLEGATGLDFTVVDGIITRMGLPNYGAIEGPLTRFARTEDPDGYAEACSSAGSSPTSIAGYALSERCGSFVAGYEAAFVAGLSG